MELIDEKLEVLRAQKTLIEKQSTLRIRQLDKAIEEVEAVKNKPLLETGEDVTKTGEVGEEINTL